VFFSEFRPEELPSVLGGFGVQSGPWSPDSETVQELRKVEERKDRVESHRSEKVPVIVFTSLIIGKKKYVENNLI
jgi:hypothetical protein